MRLTLRSRKSSPAPVPHPQVHGSGLLMDPATLDAVVSFLRDWLPGSVKAAYRNMILNDPDHWMTDPHFEGGVIVRHILRGNGINERLLGVEDLELHWADLLKRVVMEEATERACPACGFGIPAPAVHCVHCTSERTAA